MIKLRDYQENLIGDLRNKIREGKNRLLCVLPTGGGKTIIFMHIIFNAIQKGHKILIITHRQEILAQIKKTLFQFKIPSGTIKAERKNISEMQVQVGMVLTIGKRLERIPRPDLIIFDEAHHCAAKTWLKIITYWNETKILGFTATPQRLDGQGLYPIFEEMVEGKTISELVQLGWLSFPELYSARVIFDKKKLKKYAGDYSLADQEKHLNESHVFFEEAIVEYKNKLNGKPAIIFVPTVKIGNFIADKFSRSGFLSKCIHGRMESKDRDDAIEGLASGKYNVVTSCEVINEGVDVPVVSGIILLRKTKSLAFYLQACGRGLRPHENKNETIIIDFAGNIKEHGHPLDRREWSIHGSKKEKSKVKITECPKCFFIMRGVKTKCEKCNYIFKSVEKMETKEISTKLDFISVELEKVMSTQSINEKNIIVNQVKHALTAENGKQKNKILWSMIFKAKRNFGWRQAYIIIDEVRKILGYKKGWTRFIFEKTEKYVK